VIEEIAYDRDDSVLVLTGTSISVMKRSPLADVVVSSDTTAFSDLPHLAFGVAPGDGLFVV
jgi:hypothetical protein